MGNFTKFESTSAISGYFHNLQNLSTSDVKYKLTQCICSCKECSMKYERKIPNSGFKKFFYSQFTSTTSTQFQEFKLKFNAKNGNLTLFHLFGQTVKTIQIPLSISLLPTVDV